MADMCQVGCWIRSVWRIINRVVYLFFCYVYLYLTVDRIHRDRKHGVHIWLDLLSLYIIILYSDTVEYWSTDRTELVWYIDIFACYTHTSHHTQTSYFLYIAFVYLYIIVRQQIFTVFLLHYFVFFSSLILFFYLFIFLFNLCCSDTNTWTIYKYPCVCIWMYVWFWFWFRSWFWFWFWFWSWF